MASPKEAGSGGQTFQPMDKASSQTVKLNPKLELSHTELLKLLSYMEAELQARDVVIATLKTERIKSLLAYGRGGVHDPVLALQRDTGNAAANSAAAEGAGSTIPGRGDPQQQLRGLQDTQLSQLEHLIAQQRKAHQRMRHVLREAEKRHSRVVGELEEERRKHEHDTAQGDDVTYALERDRTRLKQMIDAERNGRRTAEAECARLSAEREEQRSRHKQMVLLLLEDRNRLAAQAAHHKHRAEELAKVVSEEKGRMDGMAEGLEEESKKSLQMEAELEKQLAQFDTERQQMRALLQRRNDRVDELESQVEKLQRDVCHYQKQLQEAHNVAMFQQTLSVSPPRLSASSVVSSTSPTPQPTVLPSVAASVVTGVSQTQNIVAIPSLTVVTSTAPPLTSIIAQSALAPAGSISPASSNICTAVSGSAAIRLAGCSSIPPSKTATLPAGSSTRPQPPQLPAKPPQLSHQQQRLPGTLPPPKVATRVRASSPGLDEHHSTLSSQQLSGGPHSPSYSSGLDNTASIAAGATKAVQLTATVNSVPVSLPTAGIARAVQPARPVLYQQSQQVPCVGDGCEVLSVGQSATGSPQVVQLSPRVNVSASGTGKVITSSQGGKFTFQVSTTSPAAQLTGGYGSQNSSAVAQTQAHGSRKPLPPARSNTTVASTGRSASSANSSIARSDSTTIRSAGPHGSSAPPPLPPNKPLLLSSAAATSTSKKDTPISLELKPHKLGPQTLKFGITISKTSNTTGAGQQSLAGGDVEQSALLDSRRDVTQVTQTS